MANSDAAARPAGDSADSAYLQLMRVLATGTPIVFFLSQIAFQSTWAALAGPLIQAVLFLSAISVLVGIALAGSLGQIRGAFFAFFLLLLMYWQINVFSWIANYPANINVIFAYMPICMLAAFSLGNLNYRVLLSVMFWVCLGYCTIYVVLYDAFIALSPYGVRVLPGDSLRNERLFLAAAYPTFSFFYALVRVKGDRGVMWLMAAAISGAAIFMSFSRFHMAAMIVAMLGYLVGGLRPVRIIALTGFLVWSAALLAGPLFPEWNPYSLVAIDDSGAARERAYNIVRDLISHNFFTGVGIPSDPKSEAAFLGAEFVAWDDIGALGVWYTFGFTGVLLYLLHVVLCITGVKRPANVRDIDHDAIMLSALVFGIMAMTSPGIWLGSGTIIAAMIFGFWLHSPAPAEDPPAKTPGDAIRIPGAP